MSYTSSGLAVTRFSLATTEGRKVDGEWQDATEWHRITLFGKLAETAGQYLSKGQQVYIEGRISYGSYEKEGIKRYTTDIICFNMQMLSRGEGAQADSAPPPDNKYPSGPAAPDDDIEDDLPF